MTDAIETDLRELQVLLPSLFSALRHGGPSMSELEPVKRAFLDAGLGERHGRVLLAVATTGPSTIGELATRVALTSATTSLLVGELNRAGFLERHEDDADRRRTIVSLPERLRAPLAQFAQIRSAPLRRTLEQLEPEAREHFVQGLRLLVDEARAGRRH